MEWNGMDRDREVLYYAGLEHPTNPVPFGTLTWQ